jgi:hypothetical protein
MATVNCPKCNRRFDPANYVVQGGATAAGAASGAWLGSMIGIVAGPFGGMAGTIPGAVIGGTLAYLGVSKFARCPGCTNVFAI